MNYRGFFNTGLLPDSGHLPGPRGENPGSPTSKRNLSSKYSYDARSSVRSRNSSSNNSGKNKFKIFRNCLRRVLEFTFTQVGVGGVVICYTIIGALAFQAIELSAPEDPPLKKVEIHRLKTVQNLWNLTKYFNVLNQGRWNGEVDIVLKEYQNLMVNFIKSGYDQKTLEERWTFPAALMFTLSVITMIGYGNLVPKTQWGKIGTMVYACIGIPVYILYLMSMGKVFASVLKWVYTKMYRWNVRRKWRHLEKFETIQDEEQYFDELEQQVIVPSTTCLWVMMLYLLIGTVTFAEWEGWNYLDSVYFCVTSLAKIGFGDFIPGTSNTLFATESNSISHDEILRNEQIKLVINFVYLLVGMGIVAMCYYLLKEEVSVKTKIIKTRIQKRVTKVKSRIISCLQ
ncbi:potassium channel subfamily K member 15 [Lepeophtheirus salmonis]|nr:potassium channel subfamily K member 16-like [Lepeophtheirus salmonis]